MSSFLNQVGSLSQSLGQSLGQTINQTINQTKETIQQRTMNININMNIQNLAPEEVRIESHTVLVKERIAEGGFGVIELVSEQHTQQDYVLKRCNIDREEVFKIVNKEIMILKKFANPYFVKIIANDIQRGKDDGREALLLLEYYPGGHLMERLNSRQGNCLPNESIFRIFGQILLSVKVLHSSSPAIIHRDIKLENILFGPDGKVRLCDFGSCLESPIMTRNSDEKQRAEEAIAKETTPMYRAPEMVDVYMRESLTEKTDIWALGCVFFALCFLRHPFQDVGGLAILAGKYTIPTTNEQFTADMQTFMQRMLDLDPEARPTIPELLTMLVEMANNRPLPHYELSEEAKQRKYEREQANILRENKNKLKQKQTVPARKGAPPAANSVAAKRLANKRGQPLPTNTNTSSSHVNNNDFFEEDLFDGNAAAVTVNHNNNNNNNSFVQSNIVSDFDPFGNDADASNASSSFSTSKQPQQQQQHTLAGDSLFFDDDNDDNFSSGTTTATNNKASGGFLLEELQSPSHVRRPSHNNNVRQPSFTAPTASNNKIRQPSFTNTNTNTNDFGFDAFADSNTAVVGNPDDDFFGSSSSTTTTNHTNHSFDLLGTSDTFASSTTNHTATTTNRNSFAASTAQHDFGFSSNTSAGLVDFDDAPLNLKVPTTKTAAAFDLFDDSNSAPANNSNHHQADLLAANDFDAFSTSSTTTKTSVAADLFGSVGDTHHTVVSSHTNNKTVDLFGGDVLLTPMPVNNNNNNNNYNNNNNNNTANVSNKMDLLSLYDQAPQKTPKPVMLNNNSNTMPMAGGMNPSMYPRPGMPMAGNSVGNNMMYGGGLGGGAPMPMAMPMGMNNSINNNNNNNNFYNNSNNNLPGRGMPVANNTNVNTGYRPMASANNNTSSNIYNSNASTSGGAYRGTNNTQQEQDPFASLNTFGKK